MKLATARFHIDTGPPSLFERVQFKMVGRRQLKLHAGHLRSQAEFRRAPIQQMEEFDSAEWQLRTVEVRKDSGKFVNSAWSRKIVGRDWWIVIGLGDTIMTVIDTDKYGLGPDVVTRGPLYDKVERINRELMEVDGKMAVQRIER